MRLFHGEHYRLILETLFSLIDNLPSMDLNQILVFTKVVQTGSFTAAARLLRMPKSSVSRKVSNLEDRIGARLLQRTTRKLGLTDVGRAYFERSSRIIAELEEAEQTVNRMHATPQGLLRVTAPLSFGLLGPIVAEFLERHSQVQIELVCSDRVVDLVEEGFDVAIRAGNLQDSTLIARSLGTLRNILVAAPSYLRRRTSPREPDELAKHPCIAFGSTATPTTWVLHSGEKKKAVRISPRLTANAFELMLDAARQGIGIAWLPAFLCEEDLRARRLRRVLSGWCSAETPVHAVYPSTRHLSPKVSAFVEILREQLRLASSPR